MTKKKDYKILIYPRDRDWIITEAKKNNTSIKKFVNNIIEEKKKNKKRKRRIPSWNIGDYNMRI